MDTHLTGKPATTAANGHATLAVIFDLDGVLVDSSEVMREAFAIAYAEVVGDGQAPFEEYNRHQGRYFPDIMRIMGLPLAMEQPFVRESYRLAHRVQLFDGVLEVVRALGDRGLRLAVATGKSGPRARSLLGQLGVLSMLDHVIGSDEVARPKPAPDIVLRALDLLGVRPQQAVMVGDAVTDLASARGAAVTAVAALWGEPDEVEVLGARADVVLRKPADLLSLCPPLSGTAVPGAQQQAGRGSSLEAWPSGHQRQPLPARQQPAPRPSGRPARR
jgi:3-amino-5-hydroxybenzoic acid synthesis related protein